MILTKSDITQINIELEIQKKVDSEKLEEILIIVPTNRKARSLTKVLVSSTKSKSTGKINIETLSTFTEKVLKFHKNFVPLSEAVSTVLINRTARNLKPRLKYFKLYHDGIPNGTLERIKNLISEIKREGLTPQDLVNDLEYLSQSDRNKAEDVSLIYSEFLQKCNELSAFEVGDIYREVLLLTQQRFSDAYNNYYRNVDFVVVNGFDEFTLPEVELINKISEITSNLFINFDYGNDNKSLFSHLDSSFSKLQRKGFTIIHDLFIPDDSEFINLVRTKLFNNSEEISLSEYKNNITKIKAKNKSKEIETVAKEIKSLILDKKVEPHRICVGFNLIKNYSNYVRDIFNAYGIPFNLTDRTALQNSLPIIELINLLEILENDFYYKNILKTAGSRFLKISKEIDFSNLLFTASELKIVVGKNVWKDSISKALDSLSIETNDEDNFFEDKKSKREQYTKALSDIKIIEEYLIPFKGEVSPKEFKEELFSTMREMEIPLLALNGSEYEEEHIKSLSTFIETMNEMFDLMEDEYGSEKKFRLKFYLEEIRTACTWARFNIKEKPNYGVQVTSINEIRGLKYEYLFICGMYDGEFPTRFQPEIFNSLKFSSKEEKHIIEQRYHFYQALCTWSKNLYLTFPQLDNKKELEESSFLKEFSELFECTTKTETDYNNLIYSKEEYLINLDEFDVEEIQLKEITKQNLSEIKSSRIIDKLRFDQSESIYNGFLLTDENEEFHIALKEKLQKLKSKEFSISQLETYAKCPFKYFIEKLLKVQTIPEPDEEIEATELGSLLHDIFYQFYTHLREIGLKLQGCSQTDLIKAEKILFSIAEDLCSRYLKDIPQNFYEREKILGLEGKKEDSILYRFLIEEHQNTEEPKYFEVKFGYLSKAGTDKILSQDEPVKYKDISLRGKIDRIDVNKENNTFSIVDYKLNQYRGTANDLAEGTALQLPVYLYAAKELLQNQAETLKPLKTIIFSLKIDSSKFGKGEINITGSRKKLTDEEKIEFNEIQIEKSLEIINDYISDIGIGRFPLTDIKDYENKVCKYCDFKAVCRISEVK